MALPNALGPSGSYCTLHLVFVNENFTKCGIADLKQVLMTCSGDVYLFTGNLPNIARFRRGDSSYPPKELLTTVDMWKTFILSALSTVIGPDTMAGY